MSNITVAGGSSGVTRNWAGFWRHTRAWRGLEALAETSLGWLFDAVDFICSNTAVHVVGSGTCGNQIVVLLSQSGNFAVSWGALGHIVGWGTGCISSEATLRESCNALACQQALGNWHAEVCSAFGCCSSSVSMQPFKHLCPALFVSGSLAVPMLLLLTVFFSQRLVVELSS